MLYEVITVTTIESNTAQKHAGSKSPWFCLLITLCRSFRYARVRPLAPTPADGAGREEEPLQLRRHRLLDLLQRSAAVAADPQDEVLRSQYQEVV